MKDEKEFLSFILNNPASYNIIDKNNHFYYKAFSVVLDKYGGEINEWYFHFEISEFKKDENNTIEFIKINDYGLIKVKVYCHYDESENEKIITHYKSVISFNSIHGIIVKDNKIFLMGLSSENKLYYVYNLLNKDIEPFHKLLIRKYEEFNKNEYNKNQFSKADEIKKFKELLDEGTITQEEFDLFKKDLLK